MADIAEFLGERMDELEAAWSVARGLQAQIEELTAERDYWREQTVAFVGLMHASHALAVDRARQEAAHRDGDHRVLQTLRERIVEQAEKADGSEATYFARDLLEVWHEENDS